MSSVQTPRSDKEDVASQEVQLSSALVEVVDKNNRSVRGKILVDAAGNHVRDPITGTPLIVDEDFDINRMINTARSLGAFADTFTDDPIAKRAIIYPFMINAFRPGGPLEMQRSYNGMVGGGKDKFVLSFRPAASYMLGVFGRAAGLTPDEIKAGAGVFYALEKYNPRDPQPYLDTSGPYFNAPRNARWIDEGIRAHDSGRFDKPTPVAPVQLPDGADAKIGPAVAEYLTVPSNGKPDQALLQDSTQIRCHGSAGGNCSDGDTHDVSSPVSASVRAMRCG